MLSAARTGTLVLGGTQYSTSISVQSRANISLVLIAMTEKDQHGINSFNTWLIFHPCTLQRPER